MAQNARAALADIASANGWTVRRGETIGDGDTFAREGVRVTVVYTPRGSVSRAQRFNYTGTAITPGSLDERDPGKREHVAGWLTASTADTGAPGHVAYPHANGTLYDCAGCESVCYCATLDALTDDSVRADYPASMCVRCAVLCERLALVGRTSESAPEYPHIWDVSVTDRRECQECGYTTDAVDADADREECPSGYADGEPVSRCVACGDVIDYCSGHGEIGDPDGARIIDAHDNDDHTGCVPDPDACEVAADAARQAETMARVTGSVSATHVETRRDPLTGDVWVSARVKWDRVVGAVPVPSWVVSPSGVEYKLDDASDPDRDTASGYARPVTHYVAVIIDNNGAPVDYCATWEAGQTYANDGYRVVALADDGAMSRADAQRLYDAERRAALDCFGNGHAK